MTSCKTLCVIPSYNGSTELLECIASIRQWTIQPEILVVDNASSATHRELIERIPGIRVIFNDRNLGFGGACNIGLRVALNESKDFVLLANQDLVFDKKAFSDLQSCAQQNPQFSLLAPLQFSTPETLDPQFISNISDAFPEVLSDFVNSRRRETYRVNFVNAACWLIRTSLLHNVGGFDPIFFMYAEDNEFCRRARFRGHQIAVVAAARVFHYRISKAAQTTTAQRLRWQSVKFYSNLVLHSRRYGRPFWKNHLGMAQQFLATFSANVMAKDFINIGALLLALLGVILTLFTNKRHFAKCIDEVSPFLSKS